MPAGGGFEEDSRGSTLKLRLLQLLGQGRLLTPALLDSFPESANDRGSPFINCAGTRP